MSLIEISAFQFTYSRGRLITEVSERLVGSPAFKAGGTGDPRPAGSIPVHLRNIYLETSVTKLLEDLGLRYHYLGDGV